jgi:hypothetical protein
MIQLMELLHDKMLAGRPVITRIVQIILVVIIGLLAMIFGG